MYPPADAGIGTMDIVEPSTLERFLCAFNLDVLVLREILLRVLICRANLHLSHGPPNLHTKFAANLQISIFDQFLAHFLQIEPTSTTMKLKP